MKFTNPALYLCGALLTLGPVGLRVATRPGPASNTLDPAAARAGHTLFVHEWTVNDPLSPNGDGLGPVFNAKSCVACHHKGGVGGSGGLDHNVTTFTVRVPGREGRQGVVHSFATKAEYLENLQQVDPGLPPIVRPSLEMTKKLDRESQGRAAVSISQRNTPALFGAKLIDELSDQTIIAEERSQRVRWGFASAKEEQAPVGRALRLPGRRVGKFGWKAQSASLADFVQAACANELGLSNPGQVQPRPLGQPGYQSPGLDLTSEQCSQITAYVASLNRPVERLPADPDTRVWAHEGRQLFHKVGCANCHTPSLGSIEGIYSDLLLHRMGEELKGTGSYNGPPPPSESPADDSPQADEWRTPPLWGVADSAPYMHDGRAATLEAAIKMHSGQSQRAAAQFSQLPDTERAQLIEFLKTLKAPR